MAVCVCVCLSLVAFPHYCTDLDVTWRNGICCPLVVHFWVDLQLVHGFCCYDNTALCGFEIGAYDNIALTQNVSKCLHSLYAWFHPLGKGQNLSHPFCSFRVNY